MYEKDYKRKIETYDDGEAKKAVTAVESMAAMKKAWEADKIVDFDAPVFLWARCYSREVILDQEIALILREWLVSEDKDVLRACVEKKKHRMPVLEIENDNLAFVFFVLLGTALIDYDSAVAAKTLDVIFRRVDPQMYRRVIKSKQITSSYMIAEMEDEQDVETACCVIMMAKTRKMEIADDALYGITLLGPIVSETRASAQRAVDEFMETYEAMNDGNDEIFLPEEYLPTKRNYKMLVNTLKAVGFGFGIDYAILEGLIDDRTYEEVAVRALCSLRDLTALDPKESRMLIAATAIMIITSGRAADKWERLSMLLGVTGGSGSGLDLKKISGAKKQKTEKELKKEEKERTEAEEEIRELREQLSEMTLEARRRADKLALQKEITDNATLERKNYLNAEEGYRRRIEQLEREKQALSETVERMERLSEHTEDSRDMEEIRNRIGSRRLAVIGGAPTLTNKLQQMYPKWTVIPVGEYGALPESLKTAETVYFLTSFMTHVQYERYFDFCQKREIRTAYLPRTVNLDAISTFIQDDLENAESPYK